MNARLWIAVFALSGATAAGGFFAGTHSRFQYVSNAEMIVRIDKHSGGACRLIGNRWVEVREPNYFDQFTANPGRPEASSSRALEGSEAPR